MISKWVVVCDGVDLRSLAHRHFPEQVFSLDRPDVIEAGRAIDHGRESHSLGLEFKPDTFVFEHELPDRLHVLGRGCGHGLSFSSCCVTESQGHSRRE